MIRLFITIFLIIVVSSKQHLTSQSLYNELSKVYLGADLKRFDTTLIDYFKSLQNVVYLIDTGWTIYPPQDKIKGEPKSYTFTFSENTCLKLDSVFGEIIIVSVKEKGTELITQIWLLFEKLSLKNSNSLFDSLANIISKYSSRYHKQSDLGDGRQAIKFQIASIKKSGRLSLSRKKGESDYSIVLRLEPQ